MLLAFCMQSSPALAVHENKSSSYLLRQFESLLIMLMVPSLGLCYTFYIHPHSLNLVRGTKYLRSHIPSIPYQYPSHHNLVESMITKSRQNQIQSHRSLLRKSSLNISLSNQMLTSLQPLFKALDTLHSRKFIKHWHSIRVTRHLALQPRYMIPGANPHL